ncbi:MAG: zinc ribbon domain-containing protein [Anaerolineales bacterium]|nr:zinc ribbon domain-containing protein [Anaerolineales bacterium]
MKIQKLKFLLAFGGGLWLFFFFLSVPVRAQQGVTFESVQIDLWPEYDRPDMLVVYRFVLAADAQLPTELSLRIPAAAGTPNAVAEAATGGPLLNIADYNSEVQGEWNILTFMASQREVQIEYYDPSIQKDGVKRTYLFQWPGGYDIGQVLLLVQEPIGAEEMQVLPRLNDITVGERGIVYHTGELGSFGASETFERSISYNKESESLSIEFLEIDSPPVNEDTAGRVSLVNIIPWGIGLLGVIIIVAGVYWYWATENRSFPIAKKAKRTPEKVVSPKTDTKPQKDIYCHQCGKRAENSDKFCRSCGTKLRL